MLTQCTILHSKWFGGLPKDDGDLQFWELKLIRLLSSVCIRSATLDHIPFYISG